MQFRKLRLVGFKTFAEPTEFLIEAGLTGIVGPNGCGKSNLLEAMRWAMGESASRQMRAADMEDVIFSGSGRRPARNQAEVTLTVDGVGDTGLAALAGADELEITRRIERGTGSNYRINGREVRARDVQLIFADASTGARSPAMVRQGQIGELIAARPAARRAILEEASGISGLQGRRSEAETRLKAAESNLERLEDVLTGLGTQLESLEKQARQAIRYRVLSAEIRQGEATLAFSRWVQIRDALAEAETLFQTAGADLSRGTALQEETAKAQAIAAHGLPGLRQKEAEAGAALARARRLITEIDTETARVTARIGELAERLAVVDRDLGREARLKDDMDAALTRLDAEAAALAAEEAGSGARAATLGAELTQAEARLAAAEAELARLQQQQAEAEAARLHAGRRLTEATARETQAVRDHAQAERQAAELQARAGSLPDLAAIRATIATLDESRRQLEAALEAGAADIARLRREEEMARQGLGRAEQDLGRLEAEARTLARLLAPPAHEPYARLIDAITVAPGYELALAAALGEDIDAATDCRASIHWRPLEAGPEAPPLPEGATPLGAHVTAPPLVARRLHRIGLVTREEGAALQGQLAPGQRLVSRQGDLWRWDGFTASAEAPSPAARRLEGRNRLIEIEAEVLGKKATQDAARQSLAGLRAALAGAERDEKSARERQKIQARDAADLARRLQEGERLHAEIAARLAATGEAVTRLAEARALAVAARATAEAELAALGTSGGTAQTLEAARAALAAARAGDAALRARRDGLAREAETRRRRLAAIAAERDGWTRRAAEAADQAGLLAERRQAAEAEREALLPQPDLLASRRDAALAEQRSFTKARDAASEALVAGEKRSREADQAARAALNALATAREGLIRAEERLNAARTRRDEDAARIQEAFDCAPAALADLAGLKPGDSLPDIRPLESRLERLKADRDRLGAVNLRADAEARDVSGRRSDMERERDDLVEAIKRLRAAIHQIDHEARERLAAAFAVVQEHFRALFTHLFGGGEAELRLIDSDDPLEAGLEIYARPPGKKPSTLSLLSGGEQALTAIALIFAVFLTNPAPVCVLDEVDAPLDDANVERWCDLLADMAARTATRFLVITHNPITMARMNRLFGVTMSERGVSQLVSVDLDLAEGLIAH